MDISIVITAKNEEKNVEPLFSEISNALKQITKKYEVIFVDDGSTDLTFQRIKNLRKKDKKVKVVRLRGNWGKSTALKVGFKEASGKIVFTMDADLQDDPAEIPHFLQKIKDGYDLVSGWKEKRHDPVTKVIHSRILNNLLIPTLTRVKIHDSNCGFKAYKREVVKNLNLYGELYRYIPILAAKQNFKITEIKVNHRSRKFGKSKFGWERNIKGFLDLITIVFLTKYIKRPGHFFGTAGLISFLLGFLIALYITHLSITTGGIQYHEPLLILAILLMMIGVQLVTTGLVAEMITNFNQEKSGVEEIILEVLS